MRTKEIHKVLLISILNAFWVLPSFGQEPGTGPVTVEGEVEDPLAPVRERLGPGRSALGPDRSYAKEEWSIEMGLDYGYVGSASLKQGLGTVTEQAAEIGIVASRRLDDGLVGIVGGDWQTFSFGYNGANIPLPDNLTTLNAIFGCDIEIEPSEWYMRIQLEPGVYGTWQSLGWHQVNIPGVAAFTNIVDEDFQWFIALRADVFQFFPVIPIPGIRWQFAENWLLNGSAPKPTIDWKATDDVTVFVGGDILNANVRLADSNPETLGNRSLAGALLNYFEARAGVGVSWKVHPNLSLQAEGGSVVWRNYDFTRINDHVKSTMAPYFQLAIRGQF